MIDQKFRPVEIWLAWIFTILTLLYMLPWAIAASRGKSNSLAIGLATLLLAWTGVAWVVAIFMACGAHQQRVQIPTQPGIELTNNIRTQS